MTSRVSTAVNLTCSARKRFVKKQSPQIQCNTCLQWRHLKCTPFVTTDANPICPNCIDVLFSFCHIVDDVDFKAAVLGRRNNHALDFSLLNKVKFELSHPFTLPELVTDDDLYADSNYYNALLNALSDYYELAALDKITPIHPKFRMSKKVSVHFIYTVDMKL